MVTSKKAFFCGALAVVAIWVFFGKENMMAIPPRRSAKPVQPCNIKKDATGWWTDSTTCVNPSIYCTKEPLIWPY